MQEGLVGAGTTSCTGSFASHGQRFDNWNPYVNEGMNMPTAIAESCDTYFYELGLRFYNLPPERDHALQAWASRFGFGVPTGIDIGGEVDGLLPTPSGGGRRSLPTGIPTPGRSTGCGSRATRSSSRSARRTCS